MAFVSVGNQSAALALRGGGIATGWAMNSTYFMRLADRCIAAARRSFDLEAVAEFQSLADEFMRKAEELERMGVSKPAVRPDGD